MARDPRFYPGASSGASGVTKTATDRREQEDRGEQEQENLNFWRYRQTSYAVDSFGAADMAPLPRFVENEARERVSRQGIGPTPMDFKANHPERKAYAAQAQAYAKPVPWLNFAVANGPRRGRIAFFHLPFQAMRREFQQMAQVFSGQHTRVPKRGHFATAGNQMVPPRANRLTYRQLPIPYGLMTEGV